MRLILLGAPGAGKGSQSKAIFDHIGLPSISSGNLLRKFVKSQKNSTALSGKINDGQLISDEFIMNLVFEEIKKEKYKDGYILDGVPRTIAQANMISEKKLKVDVVIYIDVPDEVVKERILTRKVCSQCAAVYNGAEIKICSQCGGDLYRRGDDTENIIQERLNVYHENTKILINHYKKNGLLRTVNGNRKVEEVSSEIFDILENINHDNN